MLIKAVIAWPACWTLYLAGDALSKIMNIPDLYGGSWTWRLYRLYSRLMIWSGDVQDWGNVRGPWRKAK